MAEVKEKEKEDPNNAKTTIGEFLMPVSAGGAAAHNGAAAEPVELDISKGSIIITENGYS